MSIVQLNEKREAAVVEVAVADSLGDVIEVEMQAIRGATLPDNQRNISVEVENSGGTDLNAFNLMIRAHSGAAYVNLLAGADWVSPAISLKPFVSVVPNTLAAAAFSTFNVIVDAADAIKIQASVAAGSTTLNIKVRAGS